MKTFIFVEKNGSGILTISAEDFDKALEILEDITQEPMAWREIS